MAFFCGCFFDFLEFRTAGESRVGHGTFRSQNIVIEKATVRPKIAINAFATCIQHQELLLSTVTRVAWKSLMPYVVVRARSVNANRQYVTKDQKNTIIVACIHIIPILFYWYTPALKSLPSAFKVLTVGPHELSHAIAGLFTCAEIESVQTDADQRGATRTRVGN